MKDFKGLTKQLFYFGRNLFPVSLASQLFCSHTHHLTHIRWCFGADPFYYRLQDA